MKVALFGHGQVGGALARAFSRAGMDVTLAVSQERAAALPGWVAEQKILVAPPEDACRACDALVLAIPFPAVEQALPPLRQALAGKVVVDCTNPVGPNLTHGLANTQSGSEFVQSLLPESHVAKCFSVYGFENFEEPPTHPAAPTMLIAADQADAQSTAETLARKTGWMPLHVGPLAHALHLEHMTLLWVKMVRVQGMSPRTAWALVQD